MSYLIARFFTRTAKTNIPSIDQINGFPLENVYFKARDGVKISAWFVPNSLENIVILLGGIRSNRETQLQRAAFYLKKGYSVLMPDLRGTGNSEGNVISFGWQERKDLQAAIFFLRKKGFKSIAAHGQSLGAAAIAYTHKEFQDFDFIVMESCYDNIDHAFTHRMEKYPVPKILYAGIYFFVERRVQASHFSLRPERFVKKFKAPTLFMAGDAEEVLPLVESQKIYKFCSSNFKRFQIFHGADHEDLYEYDPKLFESTLSKFLDELEKGHFAQSA